MKTYRTAREVLGAVEQVLTSKPRLAQRGRLALREIRGSQRFRSPLEQVAQLLHEERQYFAITIFLVTHSVLLRAASAGPVPRCDSMRVGQGNVGQAARTGIAKVAPDVSRDPQYVKVFPETRSELVAPIKIGAHVIGVIDVESDRLDAFAYEDRVLLHKISTVLARYLAGPGKYLVMKARQATLANSPAKQPQPAGSPARAAVARAGVEVERQERLRAAAGEKTRS